VITIRPGAIADLDAIIGLMDEAIEWLTAQCRTGQWGDEPISASPAKVDWMRKQVESNELWVAEIDGQPVGVMLLGDEPMPYVEPVEERELYLHLLLASRRHVNRGIGQALVDQARSVAVERGIDLIRADCYAGDDRKLVAAYERMGFTPTEPFTVKEWPGQILAMRASGSMSKTDIE
jgi:GNAT superfamily N-acetyltransferase